MQSPRGNFSITSPNGHKNAFSYIYIEYLIITNMKPIT